jgi:hypothetical protein
VAESALWCYGVVDVAPPADVAGVDEAAPGPGVRDVSDPRTGG